MVAEAELDGRPLSFTMAQTGPHWGMNSLAVVLATQALGLGLECALEALAGFAPLPGRGQTLRLSVGEADITLVDESYNANPLSVRAVLLALADRPASGRKIVVLTDMLELGASAPQAHAELAGPVAASGAALVFAAGPLMRHLFEQLPSAMQGAWRADAEALATEVLHAVRPGDLVLVKGSNGSRASTVVDAFLSAAGSRAGAAAQETL
jgi:UDP-N-acetylmuramoyl-tripeptide--D-alanyl-D-alanine ligase